MLIDLRGDDKRMLKHKLGDQRGKKVRYLRGSWCVQAFLFSLPKQRKEEKPGLRGVQSERQDLSGRQPSERRRLL